MRSKPLIAFFFAALLALSHFANERSADGADIYVTERLPQSQGAIGEFTTSGVAVNSFSAPSGAAPSGVAVSSSSVYVSNENLSSISQYTLSGTAVNQSFVNFQNVDNPAGMAVAGGNLYVANFGSYEVSEFNATTGAVVNESLVQFPEFVANFGSPTDVAVSGNDLYVISQVGGDSVYMVGEYNATTGAPINASLITGLSGGSNGDIAVSGNDLFVSINGTDAISEYNATTGAVIQSPLIPNLSQPAGIAVYGGDLFVVIPGSDSVAEYTTSGTRIKASLVTGLSDPGAIVITPEPATWIMLAIGAVALLASGLRKRWS
jgi:streptogramin lyase